MGAHFSVLASIPWGEAARQIRPALRDYPSFALASEEQKQQIYAPVRLRVGARGSLHILNDDRGEVGGERPVRLTHLTPGGAWQGETPAPPRPAGADSRRIEDFVVDSMKNCYFFESLAFDEVHRLRMVKLSENGEVIWETIEDLGERPGRGRLFIDDRDRVFMIPRPHHVAQIDPADGRLVTSVNLRPHADERLLVGPGGGIFRTMFLEGHDCYAMAALDPVSGREQVVACDAELYGVLPSCFGVDAQRRFHAYQPPRPGQAGALVKVPLGGGAVDRLSFEGLVVQAGHDVVYTYFMEGTRAIIDRYEAGGAARRVILRAPDEFEQRAAEDCRLIRVDEAGRFYFLIGEAPRRAGVLLIMEEGGALLEAVSPAPKLRAMMSAVEPLRAWQVGAEGHVYFPVLQPDSVKVVLLTAP